MSPLSIDTLQVRLAPDGVQAATRSALTARRGAVKTFAVAPGTAGEPAWELALAALGTALRHFGLRRVQLQLSQHFVQLRVLPWRAELVGDMELQAFARHEFNSAFGSIADDWRVALSDEIPGRARLAAALPHALLHAVQAQAAQVGARLVSAEPALVSASRAWRPRQGQDGCQWLLQYEASRLSVLALQGGQWAWVRHTRVDSANWLAGLPDWLHAESLMSGLPLKLENVTLEAALGTGAQQALRAQGIAVMDSGWRA